MLVTVLSGTCNVTSTQIYLVNMKPLTTYVLTVQRYVEFGPESRNVTFNITAYSKNLAYIISMCSYCYSFTVVIHSTYFYFLLSLNKKLNICSVYSFTSQTDLAYLEHEFIYEMYVHTS